MLVNFSVCSKEGTLGRKKPHTAQINIKEGILAFLRHKVTGGTERSEVIWVTSIHCIAPRDGTRMLTIKVTRTGTKSKPGKGSKEQKRQLFFDTPQDRDRFFYLLRALKLSNGRVFRQFCELDTQRSGTISVALAREALQGHGYDSLMSDLINELVHNKDKDSAATVGEVTLEEFLVLSAHLFEDDNPAVTVVTEGNERGTDENTTAVSDEELPPAPLLHGETVMLIQNQCSQLDADGQSARGRLILTNYKILFTDYRTRLTTHTPLGHILRVDREGDKTIILSCKDFFVMKFDFNDHTVSKPWVDMLFQHMCKLAFPEDQTKTFAFLHQSLDFEVATEDNGWGFLDWDYELERMGLDDKARYRVTQANCEYELCPTYPTQIVVPMYITDDELVTCAKFRSKGRIPAIVYQHPITRAVMARCSQPLSGVTGKRCVEDERNIELIRKINPTNDKTLYFMDARPLAAAVGNSVMGKGFERMDNYKGCVLNFCDIDNIHAIRGSLAKLQETCAQPLSATREDYNTFQSKLLASDWLEYLGLILSGASKMARMLSREGASVVCHCSDGWDRTSQLCALTMLMLDPYFRTRRGFAVLIEMQWLSFGHKFAERSGHADANHANDQRAPIFTQFVDCVWQLLVQFPLSFELNQNYLLAMVEHLYSCRFGTFLYNCERERKENSLDEKSLSLWTLLCHESTFSLYGNPIYQRRKGPIIPNCSPKRIRLWEELHLQHDPAARQKEAIEAGVSAMYARSLALEAALHAMCAQHGGDFDELLQQHDPTSSTEMRPRGSMNAPSPRARHDRSERSNYNRSTRSTRSTQSTRSTRITRSTTHGPGHTRAVTITAITSPSSLALPSAPVTRCSSDMTSTASDRADHILPSLASLPPIRDRVSSPPPVPVNVLDLAATDPAE